MLSNFISTLHYCLPELKNPLSEYSQSDLTHFDVFEIIVDALNPFLKNTLATDQHDPSRPKRLFHFLEKMARSHDKRLQNSLAITILKKLNDKQLKKAERYMGPCTKQLLLGLQNYLQELFKN